MMRLGSVVRFVSQEVHKPGAYLVPLRIFIGFGWLRAAVEHLTEPGWYDGSSVAAFLTQQAERGSVAFPFYEELIFGAFLPHAVLLSFVIMVGELLVGLAIATGTLTRSALLGGMFMNVNFLLAGAPNPSAFYLMIQLTLLATRAGTVLGVDAWLTRLTWANSSRREKLEPRRLRSRGALYLILAILALMVAGAAFPYIIDFSSGGSVEDPVVITVVMLCAVSAYCAITYLRLRDIRYTPSLDVKPRCESDRTAQRKKDADPSGPLRASFRRRCGKQVPPQQERIRFQEGR